MKLKELTMTIHIEPRNSGPLTKDERKLLADFFAAVMELRPQKNIEVKNYDKDK